MAAQKVADFKAMAEAVECCFITTHNARHILCDVGASSTAFVVREKVFLPRPKTFSDSMCRCKKLRATIFIRKLEY
jgi:hypothetical protein